MINIAWNMRTTWWRHQMETFSALLAIFVGNSPVTSEFPAQRPAMQSFNVFFDLRLNKHLSKISWGWWFEMPSHPLWRHCNNKCKICMALWSHKVHVIHNPHKWFNVCLLWEILKKIKVFWRGFWLLCYQIFPDSLCRCGMLYAYSHWHCWFIAQGISCVQ